MAVYVDRAFIPASVPNGARVITSQWCHMIGLSEETWPVMAEGAAMYAGYHQGQPVIHVTGKPTGRARVRYTTPWREVPDADK